MSDALLYLVRHGETEWNRDGNRYLGRTDIALSPHGVEQSHRLARALSGVRFAAAYSSPLQRARETAEIVASPHRLPVITDPRLAEIDFGVWEGMTRAEIERTDSDHWSQWLSYPETTAAGHSGETANAAVERATACLRTLAVADSPFLIVSHNTLNRLVIAGSLGMPLANYRRLRQDNCCVNVAEWTDGSPVWHSINSQDQS